MSGLKEQIEALKAIQEQAYLESAKKQDELKRQAEQTRLSRENEATAKQAKLDAEIQARKDSLLEALKVLQVREALIEVRNTVWNQPGGPVGTISEPEIIDGGFYRNYPDYNKATAIGLSLVYPFKTASVIEHAYGTEEVNGSGGVEDDGTPIRNFRTLYKPIGGQPVNARYGLTIETELPNDLCIHFRLWKWCQIDMGEQIPGRGYQLKPPIPELSSLNLVTAPPPSESGIGYVGYVVPELQIIKGLVLVNELVTARSVLDKKLAEVLVDAPNPLSLMQEGLRKIQTGSSELQANIALLQPPAPLPWYKRLF